MATTGYSNIKLNGTSLQTYGWNLEDTAFLGDVPNKRGSNTATPYFDGDYTFGSKMFDSRTITLPFQVFGQDVDGNVTANDGPLWHLQDNLDTLKALFHQNDGLQTLSYEVTDGNGTPTTREIGVELLAFSSARQQSLTTKTFAAVVTAPRPLWSELPMITNTTQTGLTTQTDFNIDTQGNAPINDMVITFEANAAGSTPSLEVISTGEKITVSDVGAVLNDTYVLDIGEKTFTKNGSSIPAAITRTDAWYMRWAPAASLGLRFDCVSGNWDLTLEYYKKWL